MKPLIFLPMRDTFRVEGSTSILTNGDFEGAAGPPPAGWGTLRGTETREAGTRTGGSGSYVGQIAYDNTNNNGQLNQNILKIGASYRFTGWCKTSNLGEIPAVTDGNSVGYNPGVSLPSWTNFNVNLTATGTYFTAYCGALAANRWAQFDDLAAYPLNVYTKNLGSAGDVLVGDGITPSTMPTQLTPSVNVRRGMSFNGSQYLQLTTVLPPLSAVTAIIQFSGLLKSRNYPGLIGKRIDATHGWALTAELSAGKRIPTFYCRGTNQYIAGTYDVADGAMHTVIGVYDPIAGVASVYVDGKLDGSASRTASLDGGAVDGTFIGGDGVAFLGATMTAYQSYVFPTAFSSQQVSIFNEYLMSEVSI